MIKYQRKNKFKKDKKKFYKIIKKKKMKKTK